MNKTGRVIGQRLNVRAGPGLDYPIVDVLNDWYRISVLEEKVVENILFYRIGDRRWVNSVWVRLDSDTEAKG